MRPGRSGRTPGPGCGTPSGASDIFFFDRSGGETSHGRGNPSREARTMAIDPKRVQAVFLAAVADPDPAGRAAVLDRECGPDADLRLRVEALLKANDEPGSVLDHPAVEGTGAYT